MTTNTNAALAEDLQDMVSKALRRAWQLGQTYWQQADSEYMSRHRKADETRGKFDALVEETRAALSTAAQPLTQDEKENQLCMSSASCGQASTNESAFITSTQRSDGTFSASSEKQSYRDSDGMPTERAVLEREWRRMKIALSAPAAQPPAGWRMVPVEPTIGMCIAGDEARITVNDSTRTPAVYRAMIAAAPKAEPAPRLGSRISPAH